MANYVIARQAMLKYVKYKHEKWMNFPFFLMNIMNLLYLY